MLLRHCSYGRHRNSGVSPPSFANSMYMRDTSGMRVLSTMLLPVDVHEFDFVDFTSTPKCPAACISGKCKPETSLMLSTQNEVCGATSFRAFNAICSISVPLHLRNIFLSASDASFSHDSARRMKCANSISVCVASDGLTEMRLFWIRASELFRINAILPNQWSIYPIIPVDAWLCWTPILAELHCLWPCMRLTNSSDTCDHCRAWRIGSRAGRSVSERTLAGLVGVG